MLKSAALALLLLQDSQSLTISSKNRGKHEFIQKLKLAQKKHGVVPMKMPNSRLVAKSVHKPGLRAKSSDPASELKTTKNPTDQNDPASDLKTTKNPTDQNHRHLDWWNWWTSEGADDAAAEGEAEEVADETASNQGNNTWWDWNGWYNQGDENDDMWSDGENQTYVADSLRDFSIKYAGCQSLTSFVDDAEGDGDGADPYYNQNFITYRLCPSESCADDSWNGCKSSYGEYMMSLEDFLQIQQDFVEEQMEYFCTFCYSCMVMDNYMNGYYQTVCDEDGNNCYQVNQDGEEQDHACYLYDECDEGYDTLCTDDGQREAEENAEYSLEDFFTCEEINLGTDDDFDGDEQEKVNVDDKFVFDDAYDVVFQNGGTAYIGTHCEGGRIGVGVFSDEYCTHYIGNQLSFYNETEVEMEISAIEEIYVPNGCLSCDQDNIHLSNYWLPENDQEYEEYQEQFENGYEDYVSEICYNMYTYSAKCHSHFGEDEMTLELSDSETTNQATTCDFIEDVLKGKVDEDGYVYSHQDDGSFVSDFFGSFGADDLNDDVTGAQIAGLIVTGLAAAGMAFTAFEMKRKIAGSIVGPSAEGLIHNECAVAS